MKGHAVLVGLLGKAILITKTKNKLFNAKNEMFKCRIRETSELWKSDQEARLNFFKFVKLYRTDTIKKVESKNLKKLLSHNAIIYKENRNFSKNCVYYISRIQLQRK